jgi:hypothetical protein
MSCRGKPVLVFSQVAGSTYVCIDKVPNSYLPSAQWQHSAETLGSYSTFEIKMRCGTHTKSSSASLIRSFRTYQPLPGFKRSQYYCKGSTDMLSPNMWNAVNILLDILSRIKFLAAGFPVPFAL